MIAPVSTDQRWEVLEEYDRAGAYHMQRDEELALDLVGDRTLPNILRLYSWQPVALTIGYQQAIESVDLDQCEREGIDVVRRPTGGRAVLHKSELTYAVIWRVPFEIGISASHNLIVEALLQSLASLGVANLELSDLKASVKEEYKPGRLSNAACFLSTSRHEATFQGKKTIGSAQRRYGTVLLQHGSILLNQEHLKLPDLLALDQSQKGRMQELLKRNTSDLSQVFGRPIGIKECANSLSGSFVDHICIAAERKMTRSAQTTANNHQSLTP